MKGEIPNAIFSLYIHFRNHWVINRKLMCATFSPYRDSKVKDIPFLPDPQLAVSGDHYKPFQEMYGRITYDVRFLAIDLAHKTMYLSYFMFSTNNIL